MCVQGGALAEEWGCGERENQKHLEYKYPRTVCKCRSVGGGSGKSIIDV